MFIKLNLSIRNKHNQQREHNQPIMKFGTKVIHAGIEPDPTSGAVMTPIYQTSTYAQEEPGKHKGFEYARTQNPTRSVLEKNIAALENGKHAICFGSGLAAMDAIMKIFKPGDEILSVNDLYGGSYRLIRRIYEKFGLKGVFIDMTDLKNLEKHITKKTKLIWLETPTNPMLQVVDIKAICKIAKKHKIKVCVDSASTSQSPTPSLNFKILFGVTKQPWV